MGKSLRFVSMVLIIKTRETQTSDGCTFLMMTAGICHIPADFGDLDFSIWNIPKDLTER